MKKYVDALQKIQVGIGGFFLLIFLITIIVQMFCRYLGITATWTEDVSMYSFIWAVFMGAAAMVYERRHFAFTSLSDVLKNERIKAMLSIFISVIMLIFSILMAKYGVAIAKQFWNYTWVNIPALKRGPTWLCLPLCGITSSVYLIQMLIEDFKTAFGG